MPKRLTGEDYEALAKARGLVWLGPEAPKTSARTRWRCQHGHEWEAFYSNVKRGSGCPHCAKKAYKTADDYRDLAQSRGYEWIGPEVPNSYTKTGWRCLRGHKWEAKYKDMRAGQECPHCAWKARRVSPDDYRSLAQSRGFVWLGPEVPNNYTKTRWRCKEGHEWEAKYKDIRRGRDCPHCPRPPRRPYRYAGRIRKHPDDYHTLAQSRGFEWVGLELPTVRTKTKWRCPHGHEWAARYDNIKGGKGCPHCASLAIESDGEKSIAKCLVQLGIAYEREGRFRQCRGTGGRPLPFDFSFHYHNTPFLIEYDGRQHYEPVAQFGGEASFVLAQRHDATKTKFAADNGYILIRIPYTVNEIETYLIEAIAQHTGLTFEQVAFPAQPARPIISLSESPPTGVQIPLFKPVS